MIFISINSNEIDEYITENNDFGVLNFHTARVCFIELEKSPNFTGMERRIGVLMLWVRALRSLTSEIRFVCLCCLFDLSFRPTREFFTHMKTSSGLQILTSVLVAIEQ